MNRSRVTTNVREIRQWAEARGGKPSVVKGTGRKKGDPGIIRIDFPGYSGERKLQQVSWDEWGDKFKQSKLAMIMQDETAKGQRSNFNKLVSRDSVDEGGNGASKGGNGSSKNGAKRGSSQRRRAASSRRGASSASRSASARSERSGAKRGSSSSKTRASSSKTRAPASKRRAGATKGGRRSGRSRSR